MGRVSAAPSKTSIVAGQASAELPDGARTVFHPAAPAAGGSLAVVRKPSVAAVAPATAVPVGVDVAAPTGTQVPTLAEFNALRGVVDQLRTDRDALRTVLNRSYLREDPLSLTQAADVLAGILASTDAGARLLTALNLASDASDATEVVIGNNPGDTSLFFDVGKLVSITGYRVVADNRSTKDTQGMIRVQARAVATDGWTDLAGGLVVGNGVIPVGAAAGLYRYFRFWLDAALGPPYYTPGFGWHWFTCTIFGGESIGQVTYNTAPAAAERLAFDYSKF